MIDDSYFDDDPIVKRKSYRRPTRIKATKLTGKKYCVASETSFNNNGRWRYIVKRDQFRPFPRKGKKIVHHFLLDSKRHVVILGEELNTQFLAALKANTTRKGYNKLKLEMVIANIQKHIAIINRYDNITFTGTLNEVLNKLLDLRGITKSSFLREVINDIILL